jgi:hypothetical protein
MIFTQYQAEQRMADLLDEIQELHLAVREISEEWRVPFALELQNANGTCTTQRFDPNYAY